ncbi:putative lipid II flippase FtsW [Brevibacillus laterosporus]|uniref:Probable peptidoglycan glycosyltransferase FtsW n=1 Tax=Brevibacillus laterosporus TaxID=1465 RepID=A0AAP3DGU3_BRELA|nr:putative lipid II flippase FtsW [Brevibacillus laterosporus]MCR8981069.1 putative lipid II flippase FtsW [Brevibacillus laterosporus]MCZ0808224.1 putative lipid II flippase FtsW [Brevibacillus laterosporus]MCZ0826583.1 putative lipid II flippase FtsW [Brevibacillus laterosporus]MCZ0850396.1 putative lipid II flippase FtsW [Brevibacillus laterosporus]
MKTRGVPDFLLLFLTLLLVGFGITMVMSSSYIYAQTGILTAKGCNQCLGDGLYFAKKQIIFAILGLFLMLFVMNIPFSFYKKNFLMIAAGSFFLLLLVYIPGFAIKTNGAHSWVNLGFMTLQTSEVAKLGLILYLSALIAKKGDAFRSFKTGLIPPLTVTGIFFLMILGQPDLGTAAIILGTAGVILIVGGANFKHIFLLTVPPSTLFITTYILVKPHAWARLTSFTDPWSDRLDKGFQMVQSLFAIARGGIFGTGFGKSLQKYLYLPEAHTDFIFSVIAEEMGLIGTSIFLLLYLLLIIRGLQISLRSTDTFATLAGTGIVTMLSIQAIINIGGVTGAIPMTGVPLPFISYGGSSLLICMTSMGILLSVSRDVNRQKHIQSSSM